MGYPSALHTVARFSLEKGLALPPAQGVFTTSETVTDSVRHILERAWGCRVFDRYGAAEGCVFASQCEVGKYHVSPDVGILEILDSHGRPAPAGELGEVVCTGLHNETQPLSWYLFSTQ